MTAQGLTVPREATMSAGGFHHEGTFTGSQCALRVCPCRHSPEDLSEGQKCPTSSLHATGKCMTPQQTPHGLRCAAHGSQCRTRHTKQGGAQHWSLRDVPRLAAPQSRTPYPSPLTPSPSAHFARAAVRDEVRQTFLQRRCHPVPAVYTISYRCPSCPPRNILPPGVPEMQVMETPSVGSR